MTSPRLPASTTLRLLVVAEALQQQFRAQVRRTGAPITATQALVLIAFLHAESGSPEDGNTCQGATCAWAAAHVGLRRATLSTQMRPLISMRLIEETFRFRDGNQWVDGRTRLYELTERGRRVARQYDELVAQLDEVVGRYTGTRQGELFARGLSRVLACCAELAPSGQPSSTST